MSLSICIPTYNRCAALTALLQSLCTEVAFHDLSAEIVVSDNASTDHTADVVADYQSRYPRIHYFRNDRNLGGTENFHLAIGRASTTHCWLLGDDSLIYPGAIRHVTELLSQSPTTSLIFLGGNNQPRSKPAYLRRQHELHGQSFEIDDRSKFLSSTSMQDLGCISALVVDRRAWNRTSYSQLPSAFIYPQIHSVLELLAAGGTCLYTHRLCFLSTRANDDHNVWYLDRAPLSVVLEWPWLQRRATVLGFVDNRQGFFARRILWKLHQSMVIAGFHPHFQKTYRDIVAVQQSVGTGFLLRLIFLLAPLLRPLVRRWNPRRFDTVGLETAQLEYNGLPFPVVLGHAENSPVGR